MVQDTGHHHCSLRDPTSQTSTVCWKLNFVPGRRKLCSRYVVACLRCTIYYFIKTVSERKKPYRWRKKGDILQLILLTLRHNVAGSGHSMLELLGVPYYIQIVFQSLELWTSIGKVRGMFPDKQTEEYKFKRSKLAWWNCLGTLEEKDELALLMGI